MAIVLLLLAVITLTSAINATDTDQELVEATWALVDQTRNLVYATIGGGAAVAFVTFYIAWRQTRMQKELDKTKQLQEIFEYLSTPEAVGYRRTVFHWYCDLKKQNKPVIFDATDALREQADAVQGAFDKASVLVLKKMVNFDEFYNLYHDMVLRAWIACEEDIRKKNEVNPHAGENFRALVNKIKERVDVMPEIYCKEST